MVKSSAVFFKQCRKELIQCKKRKQTKYSDWAMIKETHRWPIKSFVFKSSARPGWRNFSLIAWYACVLHALHVRFCFCTFRSRSQPINDVCVYNVSTSWEMLIFFLPILKPLTLIYSTLYNNKINARVLIGQSAMVYCAGKPMEKSCVFWIII